jgi:hypothetical protein
VISTERQTIRLAFPNPAWDSPKSMSPFPAFFRLLYICKDLLSEVLTFFPLMACSQASLAAEILFLRKQLAFYQERKIKPRRFDDGARLSMLLLSKLFDWRSALVNVTPDTFTGWHKKRFSCSGVGSHAAEDHGCRRTSDD